MLTMWCNRVMGDMSMGNLVQAVVLMVKVRHLTLSISLSILCLGSPLRLQEAP